MSTLSHRVAAGLAVLYGAIAIGGGTYGFIVKDSLASLIAGVISGLLLLVGAKLIQVKPKVGLVLVGLVGLALLGRFGSAVAKAGPSTIGVVMVVGGLAVLVASIVAWVGLLRPRTS